MSLHAVPRLVLKDELSPVLARVTRRLDTIDLLRRKEISRWQTSIRAIWRRRRQLLTTDDARLLVAIREVRQHWPEGYVR